MDWEMKLIKTYYLVSDYSWIFKVHNERFSNNKKPSFTDVEVTTIYLFCTTDDFKLNTKKSIYDYANRHLKSWFPDFSKYADYEVFKNDLIPLLNNAKCYLDSAYLDEANQVYYLEI
jgi:hypothetical protein